MRIAFVAGYLEANGETTFLGRANNEWRRRGGYSELIGFVNRKILKGYRLDFPVTWLRYTDPKHCADYLNQFDILWLTNCGFPSEKEPTLHPILERVKRPVILGMLGANAERVFPFILVTTGLNCVKGYVFNRASVERHYRSKIPAKPYIINDINYTFTNESFDRKPKRNLLVWTTVVSMRENFDTFLACVEHLDKDIEVRVWGGVEGGVCMCLGPLYPLFNKLWRGMYDHTMLADIYREAKFAVNLTNIKEEEGEIQSGYENVTVEALDYGTLPIVSRVFNAEGTLPFVPTICERDPKAIATLINMFVRENYYEKMIDDARSRAREYYLKRDGWTDLFRFFEDVVRENKMKRTPVCLTS